MGGKFFRSSIQRHDDDGEPSRATRHALRDGVEFRAKRLARAAGGAGKVQPDDRGAGELRQGVRAVDRVDEGDASEELDDLMQQQQHPVR